MENHERVSKLIKFPVDLVNLIEAYQAKHSIKTFAGTIYHLIRIGLEQDR
ncbi:hypothetical protein [Sporosarcina phage Lietuvens]|nr:hypothetical protein [Sporosarcina phage Lietuvens]